MKCRSSLLLLLALLATTQGCKAGVGNDSKQTESGSSSSSQEVPATAPRRAGLMPPPGFAAAAISSDKKPHACPTDATPYTGVLDFPSKFEGSDKARDDLNPKAEKAFRAMSAPITALEKGFSRQVEDFLRSDNPDALACALGLLRQWSAAGALMGEASTHTGKSMRKWALGSVASSYLRLKFSASRPLERETETVRNVEAWLGRLSERVVAEWNDPSIEKNNNHKYWAAWSVMAASVALDRRDLFDWSIRQLEAATTQIDAQGYLPNELKRDTRALYYHNYALTPLAMIAAFAKANDASLSAPSREALARLAGRVMAGVDAPESFEDKTGKTQTMGDFSNGKFAWMEPYCWTFACSAEQEQRLASMRPLHSFRLGGNLTRIFHPADAEAAPAS